jgi:hypothetical protein
MLDALRGPTRAPGVEVSSSRVMFIVSSSSARGIWYHVACRPRSASSGSSSISRWSWIEWRSSSLWARAIPTARPTIAASMGVDRSSAIRSDPFAIVVAS